MLWLNEVSAKNRRLEESAGESIHAQRVDRLELHLRPYISR